MAKDPAVLFYTNDFLSGTILLSNEQKGAYITLLCLQHQKGLLSEKDMLSVCKSYDEDVFSKFIKTDEGYYNERMKIEHEKRSNFCKSRRESVLKGIANKGNNRKNSVRKAYVKRMEDENEDVNNKNKSAIPNLQEFLDYCKTIKEINFKQYEFSLKTKYETWVDDKWKDGNGNKIKNWKTKIKSVIPYLKPTEQKQESHNPNGHIKPI